MILHVLKFKSCIFSHSENGILSADDAPAMPAVPASSKLLQKETSKPYKGTRFTVCKSLKTAIIRRQTQNRAKEQTIEGKNLNERKRSGQTTNHFNYAEATELQSFWNIFRLWGRRARFRICTSYLPHSKWTTTASSEFTSVIDNLLETANRAPLWKEKCQPVIVWRSQWGCEQKFLNQGHERSFYYQLQRPRR